MKNPFAKKATKRLRATQQDYSRALELLMDAKHVLGTIDAPGYTCPLCGGMSGCRPNCRVRITLDEIEEMSVDHQWELNNEEMRR